MEKRKAVLDALREEWRKRDYLIVYFAVPATRDITAFHHCRVN